MKKSLVLGTSLVLMLLAGCQDMDNSQSEEDTNSDQESHEESHNHSEHDHSEHADAEDVQSVEIEGLNDHYHSGDSVELSVADDFEEEGHWHWYKQVDEEDWEMIEGEFDSTISFEAVDGESIKASYYNEDHTLLAESEPVEIHIDDHNSDIYHGYFEDSQVEDREITDWVGSWQSVYPYLESGELDEVFEHKAEDGDMSAEEYKEYYTTGYETETDNIEIKEDGTFSFISDDNTITGQYDYDGYEILEYEAGNRGVRFIFKKADGDDDAPEYIQFSDHIISPEKSGHYHLYWGDDRDELLEEVDHWPTYYPESQSIDDIKKDMLQH